jgi:hypothetical protein
VPGARIPLWVKIAYTAWIVVWAPAYWVYNGPANFLWLCDVANFVIALAVWLESPLLFSSQAVGVLVIQVTWTVDFFGRLLLGFHPLGGTEYMWNIQKPLLVRGLSLFHLIVPILLLWAIWRLGYDCRGWFLQTAITWLVLPLSFLADPDRNLNWLWAPFGIPQTLIPPPLYLLICMIAYPLILYLPTHSLLKWLFNRDRTTTVQTG